MPSLPASSLPPVLAQIVEAHERRTRRRGLVLIVLFGVIAGLPVLTGVMAAVRGNPRLLTTLLPMALVFVAIGFAVRRVMAKNGARLGDALHNPARILWIYGRETRVNGIPVRSVTLALDSGEEAAVIVSEAEMQGAILALRQHAPHAIVGFGPDQRRRYDVARGAR
ncbi:MAG: hypothetical protein KC731_07750 [Myxococcales bacterium]|nr:hypothetical protein [Myxococcales bacterium]